MNNADKEPSHWRFGLFYYNKEDKRIFPPKRFGYGWTINFANLLSVSAFLLIQVIIGIIPQFLKKPDLHFIRILVNFLKINSIFAKK